MARRAALVVLTLFVQSGFSQLPPWDNQLFDFGWTPYNPSVTRCQTINVGWSDRTTANPHSTPPYTFFVISGGNAPLVIGTSTPTAYNWVVGLPAGGPYLTSMKDANGYTGGTSLVLTVDAATSGSCTTTAFTANPFQLTSSGSFAECSVATVTAGGGQAPFTMQIFAGERPPKTTTWTTNIMSYTIDLNPSEQFFFVVTDSTGATAVEGIHTVGPGSTSCYNVATTVSVGSIPTTLSYDSTSTATYPTSSTSSSSSSSGSSLVLQNTDTTTVTSVVTLANGSAATYTIPPDSTLTLANTLPSNDPSNSNSNSKVLPAAIGGAVGGAALVLLVVLAVFLYRQRQNRKNAGRGGKGSRGSGILPSPTIPFAATQIQPFPPSGNPEHAPLMSHPYSGNLSVGTPTSTYTSYFNAPPVSHNGYNLNQGPQPTPWADPRMSHLSYNSQPGMYSPPNTGTSPSFNPVQPASPPMTMTSLNRPNDLPPGAMAPAMASGSSNYSASAVGASSPAVKSEPIPATTLPGSEKATYVPATSPTPAPPPYSH